MFDGRNALLIKAAIALVVIWAGVWGVLKVTGAMKPTPEKFQAYIEENSLAAIEDPEERMKVISRMADMLNQMEAFSLETNFIINNHEQKRDNIFYP